MFVKHEENLVGKRVVLTEEKGTMAVKFLVGSVVNITGIGDRGYDFMDDYGNKCSEAGLTGFEVIDKD